MAQFSCNFVSYTLHHNVEVEVTIPSVSSCDFDPGMRPCHTPPAKYPVLYLLHGYGNDGRCWLRYTSAERYAEEHRIALVCCSVGNCFYVNRPETDEAFYDFVGHELPEFICGNFPVSPRPEDTYLCGYSMGGYGTILHAFRDPEQYCACGFFSPGVFTDPHDKALKTLEIPSVVQLVAQAKAAAKPLPKLFLCIGQKDFLYERVQRFHRLLEENAIPHRFDDLPGYEHEFAIWDRELLEFLDWLPRTDAYADKGLHKI
jgi:enterochelin esterase-like enzyme